METIIARRVIRAGRFLWTRVPWVMAGRTGRHGEWTNSLKKKRGGGVRGADRTGGGASGAPGDVTRRGLQTPCVISRMTRQSSEGSLTRTVTSIRGNYPPLLYHFRFACKSYLS